MIPKTIHYCWFGPEQKNDDILDCIESWKKHCPDFEIKEWSELNFPFEQYPFASRAYNEKKWAFVSDYVRLHVLSERGGFYLDTDMLLLQSLSPLVENTCVLGEEENRVISAGMIGAEPHHPYIVACKKFYDDHQQETITIPRVMSLIYKDIEGKDKIKVLPPKTFYPFSQQNIKNWHGQEMGKDVYGVHLWHYSWGNPINKFFKKIGIHSIGTKIVTALGIKNILKKILGFV